MLTIYKILQERILECTEYECKKIIQKFEQYTRVELKAEIKRSGEKYLEDKQIQEKIDCKDY